MEVRSARAPYSIRDLVLTLGAHSGEPKLDEVAGFEIKLSGYHKMVMHIDLLNVLLILENNVRVLGANLSL